ncbi:divergent polysaccharide deacetylase family protein [Thalassobaculum sp.]|uniref:divergent polysaccharide deacetylase family protein n=1 Tax=Thalassobaculum sp. TaxID=2022740 RepID=UPI0032EC89D3
MKLPKIRLPFLNRRPKTGDPDGVDPLDDAMAAPSAAAEPAGDAGNGSRLKGIAVAAATAALAVLVIGGTGALIGWILVNAETTEARRALQRPQLTVPILADGEAPTPNSSASAMPAKPADGRAAADPHGKPEPGPGGPDAGHGTPGAMPAAEEPPPADGVRLAAVDPTLLETKNDIKLPMVGPDGRQPWSTYGRPFNLDDTRPRVAVVVVGLGLSKELTDHAITDLPGAVSLSFSPYARNIEALMAKARRAGHETLIDLPMEPLDFPRDDPGPSTLLTSLSLVDNLNRLEWVLGRAPGYVGVATWMGSQFSTVEDALMPILQGLKQRGLMFVDSRATSRSIATELASSIQLPRAFNNAFIDSTPSIDAVDRALAGLESIARQQRYAVGIARPLPVTLDRLMRWAGTLEAKGLALAPVSAIADRQRLR